MYQERAERLNPETVGRFFAVLKIPDPEKKRFESLEVAWKTTLDDYTSSVKRRDSQIEITQTGLVQPSKAVILAEEQLALAQKEVGLGANENTEGRLPAILGRISVKLGTVNLPWYLKPFRRFTVPEHPQLVLYIQQLDSAKKGFKETEGLVRGKEESIQQTSAPLITGAEIRLNKSEQSLVNFGDTWAAQSLETARNYLDLFRGLPQYTKRIEKVSTNYANYHPDSYTESPEFLQFLDERLLARVPDEQRESVRSRLWSKGLPWYAERRAPTKEEFEMLPEDVRIIWKNRVSRRVAEELRNPRQLDKESAWKENVA